MSWRNYQNPFRGSIQTVQFQNTDAPEEFRGIVQLSALNENLSNYWFRSADTLISMDVYNASEITSEHKNQLCDANDKIFDLLRAGPTLIPTEFKTWLTQLSIAFKTVGRITGEYAYDKQKNPNDVFCGIYLPSNNIYNTTKRWLNTM